MDLRSRNVLITSNLFRPHFGGVENSLYHLSKAYLELGYRPIVVVSNLPADDEELYRVESLDGIKVFRYEMTQKGRWLGITWPKSVFGIIAAIRTYRWVKSAFAPELTVTRYHFNQVFARLAGLKNTLYLVPGVVKFQNAAQHIEKNGLRARMQWYYHRLLQFVALRSATRVSVFSHNMQQQLNQIGFKKPLLLTKPGVDAERFKPGPVSSGRKVFLCVGRCVKAKGFELAIRALSFVEDAELWIVGDGPLFEDYQQLANELGVKDRVTFLGPQSKPETFYYQADYFLMSSTYEPLGQTILEAIASGLPVIAFKPSEQVLTATVDVLGADGATYVEAPSPEGLSKAMTENLGWNSQKYQQVSQQNRQLAIEQYSWQTLAQRLLEAS